MVKKLSKILISYKKSAMTLAEVLIVLGIVGVIIESTIFSLIEDYQKALMLTQLKDTYSLISGALENAKIDNGTDMNEWYISNTSAAAAAKYFGDTYLIPYLQVDKVCGSSSAGDCQHKLDFTSNVSSSTKFYYTLEGAATQYSMRLKNGVIATVSVSSFASTSLKGDRIQILFDVNGKNPPNIMGKDGFIIELGGGYGGPDKNKVYPYAYTVGGGRNNYFTGGAGCTKTPSESGGACFALIFYEKWKIPSDYPW